MNIAKFVRVPRVPAQDTPPAAQPRDQGAQQPANAPRAWGLTLGSWLTPPPKRDGR